LHIGRIRLHASQMPGEGETTGLGVRVMAKTRSGGRGAEARLPLAMIHARLTEQLIRVSEVRVGRRPPGSISGPLFRQFPTAGLAGVMFILLSS
jgi:hypothetical protein